MSNDSKMPKTYFKMKIEEDVLKNIPNCLASCRRKVAEGTSLSARLQDRRLPVNHTYQLEKKNQQAAKLVPNWCGEERKNKWFKECKKLSDGWMDGYA